jgi:hypothetical protein
MFYVKTCFVFSKTSNKKATFMPILVYLRKDKQNPFENRQDILKMTATIRECNDENKRKKKY